MAVTPKAQARGSSAAPRAASPAGRKQCTAGRTHMLQLTARCAARTAAAAARWSGAALSVGTTSAVWATEQRSALAAAWRTSAIASHRALGSFCGASPAVVASHDAGCCRTGDSEAAPAVSAALLFLAAQRAPGWRTSALSAASTGDAAPFAPAPLRAASVKRKRLKKMNRHKKRKLIKRERNKDRGKA